MAEDLFGAVCELLAAARAAARSPAVADQVDQIAARLRGPLRLAIAGKVKAGKSTLLNAMLTEELAPTDAGECTQIVTWYERSDQPQVIVHPLSGRPQARPFQRGDGAITVDLGGRTPDQIDHVTVRWPSPQLRDLTLVDTPGIASISADLSARTRRVLAPQDDRPPVVDAVLYLLRHTHASDIHFLESFHDDELAHGTPMNAVGVLSRADEIGSCRLDALEVADRVAARYQGDGRLRRLCPVVIPVAGLLGYAGGTLRESEYRALAQIAALPGPERADLLLTADRFGTRTSDAPVTELERQHLLQRLGLFGVRLSVDLISTGSAPNASSLAGILLQRSGLERLRSVLLRQFTDRTNLLKARSALTAFESVLQANGLTGAESLRIRAEQIVSGAHEFEEVRLLNLLRTDSLGMTPERSTELDRLLGGTGHDVCSRLGLPGRATSAEIQASTLEALGRWQRIAEHPISSRAMRLVARGAVRTLEGILVEAESSVR